VTWHSTKTIELTSTINLCKYTVVKFVKNNKQYSLENTYKIYNTNVAHIGNITFVKSSGRLDWLIKDVSPNLPELLWKF
jgi:hypothetical protein